MTQELIGRVVEVVTPQTVYRGVLVEIGEAEIYIRSESGWLAVPVESVTAVREAE